ncbi:MAG TPA: glycoside hydrolase family protein [Paraburkholderia sp.]|jgi:hypothetical protein|nr:glycoside hydrolase family protein [Paraburkholderia sp.]
MPKSVTSPSGKHLVHAARRETTSATDSAAKQVRIASRQKTRLEENEEYLKNQNVKAFIYSIGDAEGGDYNLKYGGIKGKINDKWAFSNYSTHPGAGYDGHTTAAGRYQINIATWREMGEKVGLKDFSPHTQDILAVEILRSIGVIDSVESGDINSALSAASRRWAALPQGKGLPGRYKQPYVTYDVFSSSYTNYGGTIG